MTIENEKKTEDMEVPQGASAGTDVGKPAIDINLSLPSGVSPQETLARNAALWPQYNPGSQDQ